MSPTIASIIAIIAISTNENPVQVNQSMIQVQSVESCREVITQAASLSIGRNIDAKCLDGITGKPIIKIRCVKEGFFSNTMACKDVSK